jgi:triacylglycerol lipase
VDCETQRPPVVLVHGLCGFDKLFACRRPAAEYFPGIRTALEAAGYRVLAPRLSPTAGVVARAGELKRFIVREAGGEPVHIIGHSLGGLDARCMISRLGMENRVRSLTTVGTPHRGTSFADWGVARFARLFRPIFRNAGVPDDAFFDLTTEACTRFNDLTPDAPGVRYASVAGLCERPLRNPEWAWPARVVGAAEGPNDGVVSVASAAWGECNTVWTGDHLNLVNWPNRRARRAGVVWDRGADYVQLLAAAEAI